MFSLILIEFAQLRHCKRLFAGRVQSYLKLSPKRCEFVEIQVNETTVNTFYFQLTSIDPEETLKSLKLFPQETLMLEER